MRPTLHITLKYSPLQKEANSEYEDLLKVRVEHCHVAVLMTQ